MRRPSRVLASVTAGGIALAAILIAAPDSGAQTQPAATVTLQNRQFNPSTVNLDGPGRVVRFLHRDGEIGHTITFDPPTQANDLWPNCDTGEEDADCFEETDTNNPVDISFDSAGSFKYHCKVHSGMTGVVIVAGTVPTAATTTTTRAGSTTSTTAGTTGTTIGTLTSTTLAEETTTTVDATTTTVESATTTIAPEITQSAAGEDDDDDNASGLLLAVGVLLLAAVVAALIPAWRRLT